MVCKYCGISLEPGSCFCPSCGTKQEAAATKISELPKPKKKKEIPATGYMPVKKSPWMIILAVALLVIAAVGIWFSSTDTARIVGNWKCERLDPDAKEETYVFVKIEFDLFGNVSEVINKETVKGRYAINDGMLSVVRPSPKLTDVNPYQFMGDSMIVKDDEFHHPLTRTDFIPFYVIILILSVGCEIAGIVLLIMQEKCSSAKKDSALTPIATPKTAVSYTTSASTPHIPPASERYTPPASEPYIPPTTSELFSKTGAMDMGTVSAEKEPYHSFEASLADSGISRLKSTMRSADSTSADVPTNSTPVPPSDSEFMGRAGDL